MGLFDKLKNNPAPAPQKAQTGTNKSVKITFSSLPDTLDGFKALPEAKMDNPFSTAALTVLAFCFYPENKDLSLQMLDFLRGPRPLSVMDKQFIADRFRDKDYVPRSYFEGATPNNNYLPSEPYSITVSENPYSYQNEGYATLYITSGGADSPRSVQLRLAKDGKWYLWEQYLLADIRKPESENPWA
ncbi:MAG: hypothetical protein E7544_07210 [Ruminococcaceae bacterium]|nr:hypothetical protein [Oscillospiraceae bacterium]